MEFHLTFSLFLYTQKLHIYFFLYIIYVYEMIQQKTKSKQ